jgi:hypothetical protein
MTSNQICSVPVRLALAGAGLAALLLTALAAHALAGLVGGARGTFAGIVAVAAMSGVCGLVFRDRPRRPLRLTRPAPVTLPVPACEVLEPAEAAS